MKKLKNVCKKAVAVVEVTAMTMALMSGLSIADISKVSAATNNEITVNTEVKVSIEDPDVGLKYSFTPSESGTYYFFTEGELDTYANFEGDSYDDTEYGVNFVVQSELVGGETYEIDVYALDSGEFNLYVCDEANADTHIAVAISSNKYVTMDEAYTIEPEILSVTGNPLKISDEFTFKWYKDTEDMESYETISTDLKKNTFNYEIAKVSDAYLYNADNNYASYRIDVYKNGELYTSASYWLYDKDTYIGIDSYKSIYTNINESLTLEIEATDYKGNPVELSEEDYTFEWIRIDSEGNEKVVGTSSTYEIESITEDDFNYNYMCSINNYEYYVWYDIFNKELVYYSINAEIDAKVNDSVTLEPELYDYEDNLVDITGEEFTFEWHKLFETDYYYGELGDVIGTEATYTVEQVTESDLYDSNEIVYVCQIFKNDEHITDFVVRIKEDTEEETTEAPTTIEPETTEAPTTKAPETTTEAPTTKVPETTTEAPTTKAPETTTVAPTTKAPETTTVAPTTKAQEVKAPAKAKVSKVTPKKKASKTVKLTLKRVKGAKGYLVQVSKAKKFTKKNILAKKYAKKLTVTVKSKKLKNKKKLFVRARAYVLDGNGKKVYGKWSKVSRVKIK